MGTLGPRRWVLSPLDRCSHVLPADGRGRPIGTVVGVCGHVMPCSATTGAQPLGHSSTCGTCEAMSTLEIPAPEFPPGSAPGVRAERRGQPAPPQPHGLGPLAGSGAGSWRDRAGRHDHG
ncbi:MAG: hypothetical protein ACRDTE_13525 [Pseudonocardiaceae bacterium]